MSVWRNLGLILVLSLAGWLHAGEDEKSTEKKADDATARQAAESWWLMMTGMAGINPEDSPVLRDMIRRGVKPAEMSQRDINNVPVDHTNSSDRVWTYSEYIKKYNSLGAVPPPGGYEAYLRRQGLDVQGDVFPLDEEEHMKQMAGHDIPGVKIKRGREDAAPSVVVTAKKQTNYKPAVTKMEEGNKVYHVAAIDKKIVYTRFGDNDPNGMMYVLQEDKDRVKACEGFNCGHDPLFFGTRRFDELMPEPLAIRANVGDTVTVHFTNELASMPASIHIHKANYTADASAGSVAGFNADSTAEPGETVTYEWKIPDDPTVEGIYYFYSHVDPRWQVPHGLHGALIVEPKGSTYLDSETGEPLKSGWAAIIDNPDPEVRAFREHVLFFVDRLDLVDARGNKMVDLYTGVQDAGGKGISYRSAPFFNNQNLFLDESMAYGSYTYGEFSTPVPEWYVGDPMRVRVLHAGSGEHHVFHNHAHRWRVNPKQEEDNLTEPSKRFEYDKNLPVSTRIDSQTMGPGEVFDLEMEGGAGGVQRTVGEVLFHCHIIEHVVEGMWSTHRIYNTRQADLFPLPDVEPLPFAVNSVELLKRAAEGNPAVAISGGRFEDTPITADNIRDWISWQLPPQGVPDEELIIDPVHGNRTQNKANKWDWIFEDTADGPLAKGEPNDWFFGPGWPTPGEGPGAGPVGERPDLLFNPDDGRVAYPFLKPHLGRRPPFAPIRDGNPDTQGTAYLGLHLGADSASGPSGAITGSGLAPEGIPTRHYDIQATQMPITYNSYGDKDPDGMIFALTDDVADIRAGKKPAEPLVVRSNVGELVQIRLRSSLYDSEEVDFHSKVGMHIHLVQYDVQSSDGAVAGYNYETMVRPSLDDEGNPIFGRKAVAPGVPVDDGPLDMSDEVVHTTWYSDVELGTVYWHDHSKLIVTLPHGLFAALVVEPIDAEYKDRETGEDKYILNEEGFFASTNGTSGTQFADILMPETTIDPRTGEKYRDFREVFFGFNDGTRLFTTNNLEFSALEHGESRRDPERGFAGINLRSEPFGNRLLDNPDESLVYSSFIHGDPATPLLQAYVGDPYMIRTETGGTNAVAVLGMHGHRWHFQRGAPETSPLRNFIVSGVSEGFSHEISPGAGGLAQAPGDFLYYNGNMDHRQDGVWGIFRVFDNLNSQLQPLRDRTAPAEGQGYHATQQARALVDGRPPKADGPGDVGPADATVRSYDVVAIEQFIPYDSEGTGDIFGKLFVLAEHEQATKDGERATEPLVIRANAGEVIEINLTNKLSESRVGINAALVQYDVRGSDGGAVGWNSDQTAGPGETVTYRWYADQELGTVYLYNPASLDQTRHGLFGALIVEPAGSTWRDPKTGGEMNAGWAADIIPGDGSDPYREFAIFFHDGVDQIRYRVAVNYRTARRMGANEVLPGGPGGNVRDKREDTVHDSRIWGDPVTPVMEAFEGDRVVIRQLQPAYEDHHVFHLHGHSWRLERDEPTSQLLANITDSVSTTYDIELQGGAKKGDHLYHCHIMDHKKMGMWGMLRVHGDDVNEKKAGIQRLPEAKKLTSEVQAKAPKTDSTRAAKDDTAKAVEGE